MIILATVGVREIDLMTASLPRSMRRAISTSPSRVSSGTVPISRRYMRTGSFVLSSAPGVRSSSISSLPSAVRSNCFLLQVRLLGVDDLDARAAERIEQVVELVGRGDLGRQQLVDLVVQQVALFLADGNQLPYFVVFFFNRQAFLLKSPVARTRHDNRRRRFRQSPLMNCSRTAPRSARQIAFSLPERVISGRVSHRAPAGDRFPAEPPRARARTEAAGWLRAQLERRSQGALAAAAMPVTSWASTGFRRSSRAEGNTAGGRSARRERVRGLRRVGKPSKSLSCKMLERCQPLLRFVDERPNQPLFGLFDLAEVGKLACASAPGRRLDRRLSDLRADHLFCNTRLVGQTFTELVAGRRSGIRAATASMAVRNCRRPSSLFRSWPAAARSSRYSRYGRELLSSSRYASRPRFRTKLSGSSPGGSTATFTSNPSATSSSHDRAAAPWPAASGSKLRMTFDVNRRSSWPGPRSAPCRTTPRPERRLPAPAARNRSTPRPARRTRAAGCPPW